MAYFLRGDVKRNGSEVDLLVRVDTRHHEKQTWWNYEKTALSKLWNTALLRWHFNCQSLNFCTKRLRPGPLAPPGWRRPNRNMTARSYSWTTWHNVVSDDRDNPDDVTLTQVKRLKGRVARTMMSAIMMKIAIMMLTIMLISHLHMGMTKIMMAMMSPWHKWRD